MKLSLKYFAMFAALAGACSASARTVEPLNRGWSFSRGDITEAAQPSFDDSAWETVNLPHDFLISQPWVEPSPDEMPDSDNPVANVRSRLSPRGFKEMGQAWYRKTFTPSPEWKGKRVLLDVGGIMLVGDVYVNGQRLGGTEYGYLGFEIDMTPYLNFDGPNVIAVRADTGKPENSRWYTGGGLYRDVKIVVTDSEIYFPRHPLYITTPKAEADEALVVVQAEVANYAKGARSTGTRLTLRRPDGSVLVTKEKPVPVHKRQNPCEYVLDTIRVADPQRWDCDTPYLYSAEVELLDSLGNVRDVASSTFGIRKIEFSPEFGFKLNGKKTLLKGIANHHTLGALGAAAYPAAIEKRIKMLKDFGFNHVRSSHNPYSVEFIDLCDRYGILFLDELYDKWLTQYAGGRTDWELQWQQAIPEWVKRDCNHPSVIAWSLGNELQISYDIPHHDWGVTPYRMQKPLVNRYDPTRLVTVAMHPHGRGFDLDSEPWPLAKETDFASYNYRYMFFPNDRRRYPHMIFYQSEANASGMGPNFFEMDLDKVIGLSYWGMIDYLGESNGWPEKGWKNGAFDISLEPKPSAYFLRSFFKPDEPVVYIAVTGERKSVDWNGVDVGTAVMGHSWNLTPGSTVKLYTYTNADEVELLVNGKSLGRKANNVDNPKERNRILWEDVEYRPGRIEARAYRKGEKAPVATNRIETTGATKRITATPDNADWRADGTDLQHVRICAVDSKGRQVVAASDLLKFSVEGPAEIVGVINGDITSPELYTGDSRSLYNGTATVILRATDTPGDVTLTVAPEGRLKPIRVALSTK